jgi:hypothetical protein
MFSLKIIKSRKGIDAEVYLKQITDNFYPEIQGEIENIAKKVVEKMREIIDKSKVRPDLGTKFLEKSITYKLLKTHPGGVIVGIGDVSKMSQEAPYWSLIDAGGIIKPHKVPVGNFSPGVPFPDAGSFRDGNWYANPGGEKGHGYSFVPLKPIEGNHYITLGLAHLIDLMQQDVQKFTKEQLEK